MCTRRFSSYRIESGGNEFSITRMLCKGHPLRYTCESSTLQEPLQSLCHHIQGRTLTA